MLRNIKAMSAASLALTLAACDMAPKYARPELPVPQASPQGPAYADGAGGGAAIAPADTAWRDFFTDPRLVRVIETSLANNRDLRIAIANVEQARAQYKVQRADLLPTVGATGTATYSEQPLVQFGQSLAPQHRCLSGTGRHLVLGNRPVRPRAQPDQGGAGAIFRFGRKPQRGTDRAGSGSGNGLGDHGRRSGSTGDRP